MKWVTYTLGGLTWNTLLERRKKNDKKADEDSKQKDYIIRHRNICADCGMAEKACKCKPKKDMMGMAQ